MYSFQLRPGLDCCPHPIALLSAILIYCNFPTHLGSFILSCGPLPSPWDRRTWVTHKAIDPEIISRRPDPLGSFHTVYNRSITYAESSPQRSQRLPSITFTSAPQWRLTSSAILFHVVRLVMITIDPCPRYYAPSHGSSGPNSCPDGWRGLATRLTFSAYHSASPASKSSLTSPRHPP